MSNTTQWVEVSRTVTGSQFACDYSENGCPCCECEESSAVRVVYTRLRWSNSRKRSMPDTAIHFLCVEHMNERLH